MKHLLGLSGQDGMLFPLPTMKQKLENKIQKGNIQNTFRGIF